jgi:hypothetical protein
MLKLLERNVRSVDQRLVLLAPPDVSVDPFFKNLDADRRGKRELINEIQQLRGGIYLHDGALEPAQLSPEGLHRTPEDDKSWHLLFMNKQGRVASCVWYLEHHNTTTPDQLRLRNCALARREEWRGPLQTAVESELARARRDRMRYAELGGWAVAKESRCTSEGLLLALAAYSLGRVLGGAIGITTATVRHSSSSILRRLGGSHLTADGLTIPPYYDPSYKCEMELLRFDSRRPSPKYAGLIDLLSQKLAEVHVFGTRMTWADRESKAAISPLIQPRHLAGAEPAASVFRRPTTAVVRSRSGSAHNTATSLVSTR